MDKTPRGGQHGNIQDALLPLLDQSSAMAFYDLYLASTVRLGWISWILTSNDLDAVSEPLLDRCEVIDFAPPQEEHYDALLKLAMAECAGNLRIPVDWLPALSPTVHSALKRDFLNSSRSVRRLSNNITAALSYSAFDESDWAPPKPDRDLAKKRPIGFIH